MFLFFVFLNQNGGFGGFPPIRTIVYFTSLQEIGSECVCVCFYFKIFLKIKMGGGLGGFPQ